MLNKTLNLDSRTSVTDTGDWASSWLTDGGKLLISFTVTLKQWLLTSCPYVNLRGFTSVDDLADKGFSLTNLFQTDRDGRYFLDKAFCFQMHLFNCLSVLRDMLQ